MSMLMSGNIVSSSAKASQALTGLEQKMQGFRKMGSLMSAFQSQQSKVEGLRQKMVAAREKVRLMREEMRRTDQPTAAMQKRFSQAQKEAGLLGEQFQTQRKKLADLNSELLRSGVNTSRLISEQNKLAANTDKVKEAQERLTRAQKRYSSLRAQVFDWNNVKGAFIQAAAAVKAIEAPVRLAADFESAMARVKAVGFTDGRDMEGFNLMREQALRLGADTKFTAVEAAQAQENLIRAGMTPRQAMDAMTGTLNMAAAEGLSIDEASAIIAKGLGGMNLEAKLAPRYADVLAYTSSMSNTNIRAISEAMKVAAPVAASQNIPLEKVASYIGVLANKGFEESQAGNAVSSAISRLATRRGDVGKTLDALGIRVMTKSGGLVELPNIMLQLSKKFEGMGEFQQMGYMSRIFGQEYGKEMLAFMAAVKSGEQEKLQTGTYVESFGWSGKQADINLDTLNGQIDILKSAWDGLRITIGETFSPVIRIGVETLSSGLSKVNAVMKSFPKVSKGITWLFAGAAMSKSIAGIAGIAKALIQLPFAKIALWNAENAAAIAAGTGKLGIMSRVLSGMAHPIAALKAGITGLFSVMLHPIAALKGALMGLWGLVSAHPIIALGTLIAGGIVLAYNKCEWFRNWWDSWTLPDVFAVLVDYANAAVNYVKAPFVDFYNWLTGLFEGWNPFADVKAPEFVDVGKVRVSTGGSMQVTNAMRVLGGDMPPGIKPHAKGGILTTPHLGLVAEAGPEAIIPLTDKTRAVPLLMQAMSLLGMSLSPAMSSQSAGITALKGAPSYEIPGQSYRSGDFTGAVHADSSYAPVVNMTVNITGAEAQDSESIAGRIRQAVIDALEELSGYKERVAYA